MRDACLKDPTSLPLSSPLGIFLFARLTGSIQIPGGGRKSKSFKSIWLSWNDTVTIKGIFKPVLQTMWESVQQKSTCGT